MRCRAWMAGHPSVMPGPGLPVQAGLSAMVAGKCCRIGAAASSCWVGVTGMVFATQGYTSAEDQVMKLNPLSLRQLEATAFAGQTTASTLSFQAELARARQDPGGASVAPDRPARGAEAARALSVYEQVLAEFRETIRKSPIERLREQILKEMGLTEESLASLPGEEREAVEAAIAQEIKERLQAQNGLLHQAQAGVLPASSMLAVLSAGSDDGTATPGTAR